MHKACFSLTKCSNIGILYQLCHIMSTTPQKHPSLASCQLWSRYKRAQAQTRRKIAKIAFSSVFSRFAAISRLWEISVTEKSIMGLFDSPLLTLTFVYELMIRSDFWESFKSNVHQTGVEMAIFFHFLAKHLGTARCRSH